MPKVLFINGIRDDGCVKVHQIVDNNRLQHLNEGSSNVCNLLNSGDFEKSILILDSNPSQKINLDDVDLIFNQISDPDSHKMTIAKTQAICEQITCKQINRSVYCINHPDKIIKTSRENMHELLHDFPEIVIPGTIKFRPSSAIDIKEKVAQSGWSYPLLIRLCGDHNAKSLILLNTADDTKTLHPSYFERECYLTEYIDYSDEDGVFIKYRFVSVDGECFIRHIMYGDHWEIHSHVRKNFMKENSKYFNLEKDTMASFDDDLKAKIEKPMKIISDAIGLEYFGVDCSIDKQGRLIIFEANANMNLLYNPYPKPNAWQDQVDAIQGALIKMIENLSLASLKRPA